VSPTTHTRNAIARRTVRRFGWLAAAAACGAPAEPSGAPHTITEPGDVQVVGCFVDGDGDGFGDPDQPVACDEGGVADPWDCDDADPTAGGGAEVPYNGRDDDCSALTPDDDLDGDGLDAAVDCDDTDPRLGGEEVPYDSFDNDCDPTTPDDDLDGDGAGLAVDCDDADPAVGWEALDTDCDGVPADSDCDDADPALGDIADDGDCDGVEAAVDCDDTDPAAPTLDADCDGAATPDDCDDTDPTLGATDDDADCDGVTADLDCDDTDSALGDYTGDLDCDAVATADDCDDTDPALGAIVDDADCDGSRTADDCDDTDPTLGAIAGDGDCDGMLDDDLREGDVTLLPTDPSSSWGRSLHGHGDLDGDGVGDLLITDANAGILDGWQGELYLLSGAELGAGLGDLAVDEAASVVLEGDDVFSLIDGARWLDDLDGDGRSEIAVRVRELDDSGQGGVVVVPSAQLGPDPRQRLVDLAVPIDVLVDPDQEPSALATVDDLDGDGRSELMVGLSDLSAFGTADQVALVLSDGLLDGLHTTHRMVGPADSGVGASALGSAGDLDGDGRDDLFVAASSWGDIDLGHLYLATAATVTAVATLDLGDADASYVGDDPSGLLGASEVIRVDDLTGDGVDDLVVGQGVVDEVYLLDGAELLAGWRRPVRDEAWAVVQGTGSFGLQVDPLGDVDGDGLSDVLVGAPYDESHDIGSAGAVWLVPGRDLAAGGTLEVDSLGAWAAFGRGEGVLSGLQNTSVGDLNGDGVPEALVGSPEGYPEQSTVALFFGRADWVP